MKAEELLYAQTHEWVHVEIEASGAKIATVGISAFAFEALTDLVFLQLPAIGEPVRAGERFGEIESVKAVSDLYSPIDGVILEVHAAAAGDLERLAKEPYEFGWLVKIKMRDGSNLAHLMTYDRYQKQIREQIETP
jgi:glycine cleavage system H protein